MTDCVQELPGREEREKMIRRRYVTEPQDIQCFTTSDTTQTDGPAQPRLARYVNQLATRSLNTSSLEKAKSSFQANDMYVWLILVMSKYSEIFLLTSPR